MSANHWIMIIFLSLDFSLFLSPNLAPSPNLHAANFITEEN